MSIEEGSVVEESVVAEAPIKRNYVGWVALTLLFVLLAANAIAGAVKGEKPKESYTTQNMLLKTVSSQREAVRRLGSLGPADQREENLKKVREALDEPISDLVTDAETKPEAARIYAVMRTEQGKHIPQKMLDVLRNGKDPIDRQYYEIYSAEKIDPERAEKIARELPNKPFSNQLAAVHALEKGGHNSARSERISPWYAIRVTVLGFAGFGLLLTGMVAWGAYIVGRKNGRFNPLGHPIGRVTLPDADRLAIRAAQILFGAVVIQIVIPVIDKYVVRLGNAYAILTGGSIIALTVLIAQVPVGGKRITLRSLGLHRERFGRNILWGCIGFVMELPVVLILMGIGVALFQFLPAPSHPANEAISQARSILDVLPILFLASIIAPFWEEILFRGILFPALGRVTGSVLSGAIYSSLLFGIIHPQGPMLVLALAGVGAMSCGLAYQTRSLVSSITMHLIHNSALMIATLLML